MKKIILSTIKSLSNRIKKIKFSKKDREILHRYGKTSNYKGFLGKINRKLKNK